MYSPDLPQNKTRQFTYNGEEFNFSTDEVRFLAQTGFAQNLQNILNNLDEDVGPGSSDNLLTYLKGSLQQINPRLMDIALDFLTATKGGR